MFFNKNNNSVLVWTYHRVLPECGNAAVSLESFKAQIEYLLKNNYIFLTTNELQKWFEGSLDTSKKYTVLTFDDGWADNFFYAQPILKEYGIKAVLALNTGLIDLESDKTRKIEEYPIIDSKKALYNSAYNIDKSSFLTKAELIEMNNSGCWDIQTHGSSHFGAFSSLKKIRGFYPDKEHWTMRFALEEEPFAGAPRAEFRSILADPIKRIDSELMKFLKNEKNSAKKFEKCQKHSKPLVLSENEKVFKERISIDMQQCKDWLENTLNIKCSSMVWPWGHYSECSINTASELGFKMLFTMDKGAVRSDSSILCIPRIAAPSTLKRFIHQEKVFKSQFKTYIRNLFSK